MKPTEQIKELASENPKSSVTASEQDIVAFQKKIQLILPHDLKEYFRIFNGTMNAYNDRFFCFYSLDEFESLKEKFKEWSGTPNYKNIVNTLEKNENCYVFADYQCHLFTYAIRLYNIDSNKNEIYAICGDEFRLIAKTFTEFIDQYLANSDELQF